jgi:hypothetical protein
MAFFAGRFDPIEKGKVDPEVEKIYRIRDNDPEIKKMKPMLVDIREMLNSNPDNVDRKDNLYNFITFPRTDPIYNQLTEEEKIENGLPSNYLMNIGSFKFAALQWLLICRLINIC